MQRDTTFKNSTFGVIWFSLRTNCYISKNTKVLTQNITGVADLASHKWFREIQFSNVIYCALAVGHLLLGSNCSCLDSGGVHHHCCFLRFCFQEYVFSSFAEWVMCADQSCCSFRIILAWSAEKKQTKWNVLHTFLIQFSPYSSCYYLASCL